MRMSRDAKANDERVFLHSEIDGVTNKDMVEFLMAKSADVDVRDGNGSTLRHGAAGFN